MHVAAAPAWVADNVLEITLACIVGLLVLATWVAQRTAVRLAFVAVAAVLALFVYVNRAALDACARTCECQIAGQDVTVPVCDH